MSSNSVTTPEPAPAPTTPVLIGAAVVRGIPVPEGAVPVGNGGMIGAPEAPVLAGANPGGRMPEPLRVGKVCFLWWK